MGQIERVTCTVPVSRLTNQPIESDAWYHIVRLIAGKEFANRWVKMVEVEVILPKGDP